MSIGAIAVSRNLKYLMECFMNKIFAYYAKEKIALKKFHIFKLKSKQTLKILELEKS